MSNTATVAAFNQRRRGRSKKRTQDAMQHLLNLLDNFPEFAAHFQPSIDLMRKEIERQGPSVRDLVLKALEDGCWTVEDIVAETGLSRDCVYKTLETFLNAGLVKAYQLPEENPSRGRPGLLYRL
jgi:hypothetical protein